MANVLLISYDKGSMKITDDQIHMIQKFYSSGDPEAKQYVFSGYVRLCNSHKEYPDFGICTELPRDIPRITQEEANEVIEWVREGIRERTEWAEENPICVKEGHQWKHLSDGLYNIGFKCIRCNESTAGYRHIGPFDREEWIDEYGNKGHQEIWGRIEFK